MRIQLIFNLIFKEILSKTSYQS